MSSVKEKSRKTVFILSVSSDIGLDLAKRYLRSGHRIIGTYRSFAQLAGISSHPRCHLFRCDITQAKDVSSLVLKLERLKKSWDVFISCVGDPRPLSPFFKSSFDEWSHSIHLNLALIL